jgi:hypothetical protein
MMSDPFSTRTVTFSPGLNPAMASQFPLSRIQGTNCVRHFSGRNSFEMVSVRMSLGGIRERNDVGAGL